MNRIVIDLFDWAVFYADATKWRMLIIDIRKNLVLDSVCRVRVLVFSSFLELNKLCGYRMMWRACASLSFHFYPMRSEEPMKCVSINGIERRSTEVQCKQNQ